MIKLLVLALTAVMALGQSDFSMQEYCSLVPASWRGLYYNHTKPFVVTAVTDPETHCYYSGMTFEVIVAVKDVRTESYTDFILQANPDSTYDMRAVGKFAAHPEFQDVITKDCDNGEQNVIMNSEGGMYYAHSVYWTAPNDMDQDIIFNATFIDSRRGIYWTQKSMYPIKFSFLCDVPDVPYPSASNIPQATSVTMILLLAILNACMVM